MVVVRQEDLFGDVCWENASSVLRLRLDESSSPSSAVVGLRYPLAEAHNCSFAVTSDTGALVVVVRLLNLRRDRNGTCLDYVALEEGPRRPLIFKNRRCALEGAEARHAVARGVVHVHLSVTPPVDLGYTGVNIAFTAAFLEGEYARRCDSSDMFRCATGGVCISQEWTCNGINNCGDDSDEPRHLSSEHCLAGVKPEYVWGPVLFSAILLLFSGVIAYVVLLAVYRARVSLGARTGSTSALARTPSSEEDADVAI
ncbi:low-density lipoprotein receptor-related protein 3-like [Haemaphysalis longicornis]